MIKGLYSAFDAMEAAWRYQDVLANNVANSGTTGYKREVAAQQSFADVLLSQQSATLAPLSTRIQEVVGQIGTGSFMAEFSTDFSQGITQNTGNELDFALSRGFFQIEAPDGTRFYTRDGRFGRDASGDLVDSRGNYVLNANGGHVNLPADRVSVESDGTITAGGQAVDQLAILDFAPAQLNRSGEGYFTSADAGTPIDGGLRQGFLEGSNSNIVEEMTSLLAVQRVFQANQTVIARLDGTLDQAAGQLGRFGA